MAFVKRMVRKPKQIALVAVISAAVGVVVALNTQKQYTASVVLAPEMSGGGMGLSSSISDMASNFGIDLGSASKGLDAIYPEIYPELFTSYDFIRSLFTVPVRTKEDNKEKTYLDHLIKDTKIPFWDYPKAWLIAKLEAGERAKNKAAAGKADPFRLSQDDYELCDNITNNIKCLVDKKTSVITITTTDSDPLVAAILADTLQRRLQTYVTDYRTKKSRQDCAYYQKLYEESQAKYKKVQKEYATFCDANQNVVLESVKVHTDELENELQLAFNTMSQFKTQLQAAEAKVQERTPAFTIVSEPKMPYKSSSMPRKFIVLLFIILGCGGYFGWMLYKEMKAAKTNAPAEAEDNAAEVSSEEEPSADEAGKEKEE